MGGERCYVGRRAMNEKAEKSYGTDLLKEKKLVKVNDSFRTWPRCSEGRVGEEGGREEGEGEGREKSKERGRWKERKRQKELHRAT